jgi:hypothetical protein
MQSSSPAPRVSRRLLVVALALLGIIGTVYLTLRLNARHSLEIFLRPSPVPSDLRVLHKRGTLFSSFYHFSGSPAVIDSIIQLKGLVEVPTEPPESSDMSGFSAKERTKVSWEWWQPTSMPGARFYFLHHKSEAVQGWSEGWWVSGATNEVYAFIGG